MFEQPSSIQFFNSPTFPNTVRLPGTAHLLCSACETYGRLCHAIGHQVLLTKPLAREAEDFQIF